MTVTNGESQTLTSTGSSVKVSTTGFATVTSAASLNTGSSSSSSSGMSDNTKKIIGGVVGGVGGAIVLGALAVVAWRIWGRKKNRAEDDDDYLAGSNAHQPLNGEKLNSSSPNDMFNRTLESHHTPGGRVNAAANF